MLKPGPRWSRRRKAAAAARRAKPISPAARPKKGRHMEPKVADTNGVRHELVSRVRQEIAAGAYDTPSKLEAALERLFDRLTDD